MKKLFGVTTAMTTPFLEDGSIDFDSLRELTDFLIEKGVNCLYPMGTTGEMFHIPIEERMKAAEVVVKQAAKRCTVFIHCGAMCQEDTIRLARHAESIGADGIGVVTPVFFGATDRELEEYYVAVANSVSADFSVYLYAIPQLAVNDLRPDVVGRIAQRCKNVVGIKYSYPDMIRIGEFLKTRGGNFSVLVGPDKLFYPALCMGCDGTVSGVSGVYPEPFVEVYKAYLAGDNDRARKMQNVAIAYVDALRGGSNMAFFKSALKMRGLKSGHMKAPQLDLLPEEDAKLADELAQLPNLN